MTLAELLEATAEGEEEPFMVVVCHGPPRCNRVSEEGEEWQPCLWCYRFSSDDPRTTDEIIEDMTRGH